ncbi:sensory histidine kinase AtoS [Anaerohalosphaera lusitana]|uniref:Sensory histidine kinase AtoS n=1 Tax=Anaerohalosphaera lusitana TaxID=1936003 RepID=A0A1U9NHX1_9BACT|nr:ATP-binding protein [Anaerohalosphaera lusitana]AQT67200.1 sensory histidine kinase AtoS [Anaerohalosphaera lusitana]
MSIQQTRTEFAPPDRAAAETIKSQVRTLQDCDFLHKLYDAVSEFVFIVNTHRQIIFANRAFLDFLGALDVEEIFGRRPGEVVGCIHARKNPAGCGTTNNCSACGAVNAVLTSINGKVSQQQCSITRETHGDDLELQIRTSPIKIGSQSFVVAAVSDISHENRRRILERIFFHDILNTAAALKLGTQGKFTSRTAKKAIAAAENNAARLIEEIRAQRDLLNAESGDLSINPESINSLSLLTDLRDTYHNPKGPAVILDPASQDIPLLTDPTIFSRVLRNMVKNAVEASDPDHRVTLGCTKNQTNARFTVHNPTHIPETDQLKIFQRSFTTKGKGRGLGTYSMKLLTERYLKGKVTFTSTPEKGTTFTAEIPLAT